MDQEFINLMQILLGNPNPTVSSSSQQLNPDYTSAINNHVIALNNCLNLKGKKAFFGNHICSKNLSSTVIGPVPFASSGEKPLFAVFGLNPLFNIKDNSVCEEKQKAGNDLANYAAFYNSQSCTKNGVFPFVLNPMSPYYRNIFKVFYSIFNGNFISWTNVFRSAHTNEEKANKYIQIIKECQIIVAELIPFHSQKTETIDINKLYNCNLNYRAYHEELFSFLNSNIDSNGIIFSHGKAASQTFRQMLNSKNIRIKRISNKFEIAIWNGRLVIIMDQFLGTVGGINSNVDFENLINEIKNLGKIHFHNQTTSNNLTTTNIKPLKFNKTKANPDKMKKKNRVTFDIEKFSNDKKGLTAGDEVVIMVNGVLKTGKIERIFDYPANKKQEAQIRCTDGKRNFKVEDDITKI